METMKLNQKEETTLRFRRTLEGSPSFGDAVNRLMKQEGLSDAKAVLQVAKMKPALYNQWVRSGRPDIQFVSR